MRSPKPFVVALAFFLAAASPAPQPDESAAQRLRADVEFLASDRLEGRDTGSEGHNAAAAYVASQFQTIGLKPGGGAGGWYQQVPLRRASHARAVEASLVIGGRTVELDRISDFAVRPSVTQQVRRIDAPLVFAGHGISDARLGIDDYAGLDVRGKIVLVLEGAPAGLPIEVAAHVNAAKTITAAAKGAAGLIEIARTGRTPAFDRLAYYRGPVVDWVDSTGRTASASARLGVAAAISTQVAERLLAAAGRDFSRTLAAAARPGTLGGFDLPARLRLSDTMQWRDFTSPNVIGLLPGADPALKHEHVVVMAHLDHIGVKQDAKPGEDRIHNGAIDNAAGVATMLESARKFVASGKPPRRSILFVASTAEEPGLRGADYFAANPVVPLPSIVALVNFDMPVLLYEFTDVIAFGADRSSVGRTIAEAGKAMDIAVSPDPMPREALFIRSDHYRFVTRGIPAVLLMTGYGNGGEAKWKSFLAGTYHKPGDDLTQPIRWDQGARYAELGYRIARALADSDGRPLWYSGDYFGDTFAPGQPRAER